MGEEPLIAVAAQMDESGRKIETRVRAREPASGNVASGKYSRIAKTASRS
jgi:hypothetical protein